MTVLSLVPAYSQEGRKKNSSFLYFFSLLFLLVCEFSNPQSLSKHDNTI